MLNTLLHTITGSRNVCFLGRSAALVARVNEQRDTLRRLPDATEAVSATDPLMIRCCCRRKARC